MICPGLVDSIGAATPLKVTVVFARLVGKRPALLKVAERLGARLVPRIETMPPGVITGWNEAKFTTDCTTGGLGAPRVTGSSLTDVLGGVWSVVVKVSPNE